MKKEISFIIGILLLLAMAASGQDPDDPGLPDSVIVERINIPYNNTGTSYANIRVYFVTDDSVTEFFLPLKWRSWDNEISAASVSFHDVFLLWESMEGTVFNDSSKIRIIGYSYIIDTLPRPPLYTNNRRVHGATLRFAISPQAEPQYCWIDTTTIGYSVRLFFGINGNIEFYPVFVPGYIRYGEPLGVEDDISVPASFELHQNYPNPFNAETIIEYYLAEPGPVTLSVYNLAGQKTKTLASEYQGAGLHKIIWDGTGDNSRNVPSGVYFYRLTAGDKSLTKKMLMLK